jgi:DNA (cytosine-5)-methyltransferase 1
MGLHRAWPDAEIIGVDINLQPHYPFMFVQADAMTYPIGCECFIGGSIDAYPECCDSCGLDYKFHFDFIWASPPCQGYTLMRHMGKRAGEGAPKLIEPIRLRLKSSQIPFVIENVVGAPLVNPITICGSDSAPCMKCGAKVCPTYRGPYSREWAKHFQPKDGEEK